MRARERGLLGVVCALGLLLAAPAAGQGAVRFASSAGGTSGDCGSAATACSLEHAVEVVAANGDEVIVLPGTYAEGGDFLDVGGSRYVHGAAGQPVPLVSFSTAGVRVAGNATVAGLAVANAGPNSPLWLTGGTAEQIRATTTNGAACLVSAIMAGVDAAAVLRDSFCWGSGADNFGVWVTADGGTATATLRNVTAIATSGTLSVGLNGSTAGPPAAHVDIDAKNVIAQGQQAAVEANTADGSDTVDIALEYSNYATELQTGPGTEAVTDPGSPTNQTAAPVFASAPAGDFHQLSSSPTVDAAANTFLMGSFDVDGQGRSADGSPSCFGLSPVPDIGADELVLGSPDCGAPDTAITSGFQGKTRRRRAIFSFLATEPASFQCSLDEQPFAPCLNPHTYLKVKRGNHLFSVRAVDAVGNIDPSPAQRSWRVTKGKKKGKKGKGKRK